MNKILAMGPAWVGDMVMAQSLFRAIKHQDLKTIIDVLAPEWSAALVHFMPEVRQGIPTAFKRGALQLLGRCSLAKRLRAEGYTQAIVLQNSWKAALIPWWANIPQRTGFLGEFRFGLLNDVRRLEKNKFPRLVDRYISLAYSNNTNFDGSLFIPNFLVDGADKEKTLEKFSINKNAQIVALCPGAEFGPSKRWPAEYYGTIACDELKKGKQVWILGSKNDVPVAQKIQEKTNQACINFTGNTSLVEVVHLLSAVDRVVTNDSGLMHIAAALEKPLVALYGSTDPGYTPPLSKNSKILQLNLPCSPCFKRECPLGHHACMVQMLPKQVETALQSLEGSCAF